jgi:hypothetical protein
MIGLYIMLGGITLIIVSIGILDAVSRRKHRGMK